MMSLSILSIAAVALADRFLFNRKKTNILSVTREQDAKSIRFILKYESKAAITDGELIYSLRSLKRPNAVVVRARKLNYSLDGLNTEYLTFEKSRLEAEAGEALTGGWVLDVKIQRSCSRVNPLYKIFPVTSKHTEVLTIA